VNHRAVVAAGQDGATPLDAALHGGHDDVATLLL
jgi:hypothetical protein